MWCEQETGREQHTREEWKVLTVDRCLEIEADIRAAAGDGAEAKCRERLL